MNTADVWAALHQLSRRSTVPNGNECDVCGTDLRCAAPLALDRSGEPRRWATVCWHCLVIATPHPRTLA